MSFLRFFTGALVIALGAQTLPASTDLSNNILQFQIKKESNIISSGYSFFSTEMARSSGDRQGLLSYKCKKNADKSEESISVDMYGVDNYMDFQCKLTASKDADCELKISNAISRDKEAISEYNAKSCKPVKPEVITHEFKFTLKKNSTNNISLPHGYSFLYAFQEEK